MEKIVCKALLLVIFLAACGGDFDYETRHGIAVRLGEINRPSQQSVELWTDDTLAFWNGKLGWDSCMDVIDGSIAIFADEVVLTTIDGRKAWGYCDIFRRELTLGLGSEDANKRKQIVSSVFKHELSHLIAYACIGLADEAKSHQFFRDVGAKF